VFCRRGVFAPGLLGGPYQHPVNKQELPVYLQIMWQSWAMHALSKIVWSQVFTLKGSKGESGGAVAGCRVSEGALKSAMQFRVLRDGEVRVTCSAVTSCSHLQHPSNQPHDKATPTCVIALVQTVHEGRAASLKRAKQAVDTVGKGTECGLLLDGWDGCQVSAICDDV
jgi:translation initiation factor IF-2